MNTDKTGIILFDGVCTLCNSLVKFIIKRDNRKQFKFAPLQSEKGKSLLHKFQIISEFPDTIVYIKNDRCYLKSDAVLRVLIDLGGVWRLFFIFKIIPIMILNILYDCIAKFRYQIFGKESVCMLPSPDIRD